MKPDHILHLFFEEQSSIKAFLLLATRDYHTAQDLLQQITIAVVKGAEDYDETGPSRYYHYGFCGFLHPGCRDVDRQSGIYRARLGQI